MEINTLRMDNGAAVANYNLPGSGFEPANAAAGWEADWPGSGKCMVLQPAEEDKEPDKSKLENITKEMNNFMDMLDTNIRFTIHQPTNTLVVQIMDAKDQRVIKEFPPQEFLDTIARIRDYVGMLLDKKA
mgnify:CR=1 FL=1